MVTKLETEKRILYNISNMEGTTENLRTVVEAIIEQRIREHNDVFEFDFSAIEKKIKTPADVDKYGIDVAQQRLLLEELSEAERDIIEICYVNEYVNDVGIFYCKWNTIYPWLQDRLYPEMQPEAYPYSVFIHLDYDGVKKLRAKYNLKVHKASLEFNEDSGRFTVICNAKRYKIKRPLSYGKDTTKIISFAWKYRPKYINVNQINKYAGVDNPVEHIDDTIKNCTTVVELLKSFVDYNDYKIQLNDSATLTDSELELIAEKSDVQDNLG